MADADLPPGLHFAGVNTWMLMRYLRDHAGPDVTARVLAEAEETRTEEELFDLATWSSYDQFRRLLAATAATCGSAACEYRVRWFPEAPTADAEYLETRNQVLTARLESLQELVGDLVSDDDLEDVLARIIVSAARTISAPVFVLALEALPTADK